MKARLLCLLTCLTLLCGSAAARVVRGTVVSASDKEPVVGASVFVTGTKTGTSTDIDGKFTIDVPESATTLLVTYVGMVPNTVKIAPEMTVVMETQASALDEVVVVAYGTQKKSSITGAISQVNAEEISARPVSSVTSALEGASSGITVMGSYGEPGSSPSISIRGVGTVNGSNSPLYVVDGVPYAGEISDFSPEDIESI